MSTNLEKRGGRPAKLNAKKSDRELERHKKRRTFFVGRTTWKICRCGEKKRNTRGHQGENEPQWKKKRNKNTYDISFIKRVTRTFLELSRCSRAKQGQRNVQKKRDASSKLLFCSLDLLLFFHRSRCLRRLALHDFIFCWSKLSRALLLALAKSIYFHNISYSGDEHRLLSHRHAY